MISILLVVSRAGKVNIPLSPFAPENLVSRDGFGGPVPREPAHVHTQPKDSRANSIMSGRSPPLYCTLPLIAMQGIPGSGFIFVASEYPSMTNKEIIQYTNVLFTQAPIRVCLHGTNIDSRTILVTTPYVLLWLGWDMIDGCAW